MELDIANRHVCQSALRLQESEARCNVYYFGGVIGDQDIGLNDTATEKVASDLAHRPWNALQSKP